MGEKVAIVSYEVCYAGSPNKDEFWKNLLSNKPSIAPTKLYPELHEPATTHSADIYINHKYGSLPSELSNLSEHELLLQTTKKALQTCTITNQRTGMINGALLFPQKQISNDTTDVIHQHLRDEKVTMNYDTERNEVFCDPASYVGGQLGFGKSCFSIDAACSTSLYTLQLAEKYLLNGDSDVMICSACCSPETLFILTGFSVFHALAKNDSFTAPFDANSSGLNPGEGCAVYVLKRLSDAMRDGDTIHGVILGASVNNAGKGTPLKPDLKSQIECMEYVYREVDKASIQYIECHATGTPLGDKAELDTIKSVFGDSLPKFGSSKGNFGHTLVAAGFAGLTKLLLSMKHGIIPPTPSLREKMHENVVSAPTPWNDSLKRAGISAFGFGGTNGHIAIEHRESWTTESPPAIISTNEKPALSIIGMACHFGTASTLDAFEDALYDGGHTACNLPEKRWRGLNNDKSVIDHIYQREMNDIYGGFIDMVEVNYKKFKTSLLKEDELLPTQLLAISTMIKAVDDVKEKLTPKTAVLISCGTDITTYTHQARVLLGTSTDGKNSSAEFDALRARIEDQLTSTSYTSCIGNLIATRVSSTFGFKGASFAVTEGENSAYKSLEIARHMLMSGEVNAVVIGSVDMNSCALSFLLKSKCQTISREKEPALSFEADTSGIFIGEGAGAVVVTIEKHLTKSDRVYAQISHMESDRTSADACKSVYDNVGPDTVDHVDLSAIGGKYDADEIQGLHSVFQNKSKKTAFGSVSATTGALGYCTGMASLIKGALCVYNRYLPTLRNWKNPNDTVAPHLSPFYTNPYSTSWMKDPTTLRRFAINGVSQTGSCYHLIMDDAQHHYNATPRSNATKLMVFRGDTADDLLHSLTTQRENSGKYACVVFVAHETKNSAIQNAIKGVQKSFQTNIPWTKGGYFSPTLVSNPKISFVYGDGSTPYDGLGRDLFRIFPQLHEYMCTKAPQLWSLADDAWNVKAVSEKERISLEEEFKYRQLDKFVGGVYYSTCFTEVLTKILNIQPDSAFGLSMGEIASLFCFSDENSRDANQMINRLYEKPTWSEEMAGKFNVLQRAHGIDKGSWAGYLVYAPAAKIDAYLAEHKELVIHIAIVNDNSSTIICGISTHCQQLIKDLGLLSIESVQGMVGHCPETLSEFENIKYMHDTLVRPNIKLYGLISDPTCSIGENVAKLYTTRCDFPKTVQEAANDGNNLFIEAGVSNYRALAIQNILKNHSSTAFDHPTKSTWDQVLNMLAFLISNGQTPLCEPFMYKEPLEVPKNKWIRQIQVNHRFSSNDIILKSDLNIRPYECIMSRSFPDLSTRKIEPYKTDRQGKRVIWDEDDMLEFAEGKIGNVFGPKFDVIDSYKNRVLLPMKDYLLVTRVTKMEATTFDKFEDFQPGTCTTEFDIPKNAWFSGGGDVPWCVAVESGQCDLLLISYMGIDFINKGYRAYRLLNTTLKFLGECKEGDTLVYDISVDSFASQGDVMLMFFSYNCYVDGKRIIEMRDGCAGFFTEEELAVGKGVVWTASERKARGSIKPRDISEFNKNICSKSSFSETDMKALCARNYEQVMGSAYSGLEIPFTTERILMIDRITHLMPNGGPYGLGLIMGEKILHPKHWYFPCHFMNDEVMAGSLVCEGCSQLLRIYALYLGLHETEAFKGKNFKFIPMRNQEQKVRCRGQIRPHHGKLVYWMEIKDISFKDGAFAVKADVNIIDVNEDEGQTFDMNELRLYGKGDQTKKIAVDFKNIAIEMVEGDTPVWSDQLVARPIAFESFDKTKGLFNWDRIQEHATGTLSKCLGPEQAIFDDRKTFRMPNGELQLTSRILSIDGKKNEFKGNSIVAEFDVPKTGWCGTGTLPVSALIEIILQPCGFLSSWCGSHLLYPDETMLFRNLSGSLHVFTPTDCSGKTIEIQSEMISHNALNKTVVQKFRTKLLLDGTVFFDLTTQFGWFTEEQMRNYKGLDNGKTYTMEPRPGLVEASPPHAARHELLQLIDRVEYGDMYVKGTRKISSDDWYFAAHYHMDPVQPGSLGVETMVDTLERYYLHKYGNFDSARVAVNSYMYRGQVVQTDTEMTIECFLEQDTKDQIAAKCYLIVNNMRVYEVNMTVAFDTMNDALLSRHPLAGVNGNPTPGFIASNLKPRPVCFVPFAGNPADENHGVDTFPMGWYNIAEFTLGNISKCFGDDYKMYDNSTISRMPNSELQLVTRVLDITGKRYDMGTGSEIFAEFDVPEDAWFFNGDSNTIPYSILMELGLQPCGFMTAYLGTSKQLDSSEVLFRNLDGNGELLDNKTNLRGKTLTNHCKLVSKAKLGPMVVESYTYELAEKETKQVIYRGKTTFGWFLKKDMLVQKGLDGGKEKPLWYVENRAAVKEYSLASNENGDKLLSASKLLRRPEMMELIDTIHVADNYIHGSKQVNPSDWFFSCHFWLDPVMPGSLGIEAFVELLEFYAIEKGLDQKFRSPEFRILADDVVWKYRGQLIQSDNKMDLELHVDAVEETSEGTVLRAKGSLWVDGVRKYTVANIGIVIAEKAAPARNSHFLPTGFTQDYKVDYPLYSGAMAKGIASADLVIQMGKNNMLGSFGAGGLPMHHVEKAIIRMKEELPNGNFAVNLIHSPFNENLEKGGVDLFLKYGVTIVEASAFMTLTKHVVRYRVCGLSQSNGTTMIKNKLIAKVSRTELAEMFAKPPPEKFLNELLAEGSITEEQAALARTVAMADDIAVESDSGGHSDNRPANVIFPMIYNVVKDINPNIRIGLGGGIGCPQALSAAFAMGADFVVTGTINQMTRQAGTSDKVRELLSKATYSDVAMAPAADMFDQGVELQVLKRGTFFPARAKKLYTFFRKYKSLDDFSIEDNAELTKIFGKTKEEVWEETKHYYVNILNDEAKVISANKNPKTKMSMTFRWYLGLSSFWANTGVADRSKDYQIWCGPAIGSFNQFIKGTRFDPSVSGVYPDVAEINRALFEGIH